MLIARRVSASHGLQWVNESWGLFRMRPGVWVALGAITLLPSALLILQARASWANVLAPVLTVVWATAMTAAAETCRLRGTVRIVDAFDGLRLHERPLLVLCAVALLASLVCRFAEHTMTSATHAWITGEPGTHADHAWLAALVLYVVVAIGSAGALWLAPVLIVVQRATPLDAMKASLAACWRSRWAALVYGMIVAGLTLAALLTLGIGLLVVTPLFYLSSYTACRDLFVFEPPARANQPYA